MNTWAIVKFEFEGLHRYDKASGKERFLSGLHRHIFKCEVWVRQFHNDRDVEYVKLNRQLKLLGSIKEKESCEMVAENIRKYLASVYPQRGTKVFVMEDGENGCCIED